MKSIRSFLFAAVLTLGGLGPFAGLAHAQSSVHGKFNLPYTVNWQNTVVPAGDYEFYLRPAGGSDLLTVQKIGGSSSWGFLVLVHPPESGSSADVNKLVFGVKEGQHFVSSMQLPEFGLTVDFTVPEKPLHSDKQIARAESMPASASAR
jgi:hypothetical protein